METPRFHQPLGSVPPLRSGESQWEDMLELIPRYVKYRTALRDTKSKLRESKNMTVFSWPRSCF